MISKDLEAKIITAIETQLATDTTLPSHFTSGLWQPSAAGVAKGEEPTDAVAVIATAVSGFSRDTFSIPSGSFSVAITLAVRDELDSTGAHFLAFADKLESLFDSWQSGTYQQAFETLDVPGFSVGNVAVSAGIPSRVKSAAATSISWNITLSGCKSDPTSTNPSEI